MTRTIELTAEEEARIRDAAQAAGIDPDEYWNRLIGGLAAERAAETRRLLLKISEHPRPRQARQDADEWLKQNPVLPGYADPESEPASGGDLPKTPAEIVAYWEREGLIGTRPDITDSQTHAREIRRQAERQGR